MKIEIMEDKGLEKKLHVTIPQEELQKSFEKEVVKRQARIKLDGFRPGKAPKEMIYKQFGESFFDSIIKAKLQEAVQGYRIDHPEESLLSSSFSLETQISRESVEKGELSEVTLNLTMIFKPKFPEMRFEEITLEVPEFSFSDEFVQSEMENFARTFRTSVPLKEKRKAQKGDTLVYSMEYQLPSGEKKEIAGSFILGASEFPPEFEKLVLNVEEGHSITERLRVPKNFPDQSLSNQKVLFKVSFTEVRETTYHELNEAFLKEKGFETLEDFKTFFVEKVLQKHSQDLVNRYQMLQLESKIRALPPFDVPQSWVEKSRKEWDEFWDENFKDPAEGDAFLSEQFGVAPDQKEDFFNKIVLIKVREIAMLDELCAQKRVFLTEQERRLIIQDFVKKMNIEVSLIREILSVYPNFFDGTFQEHRHAKLFSVLIPLCAVEKKAWDFEEFRNSLGSIEEALKRENMSQFYVRDRISAMKADSASSEEPEMIEGETLDDDVQEAE